MEPKQPLNAARPFPWRCRHCNSNLIFPSTIRYEATVRHDGRMVTFIISQLDIPVCQACSEKVFTEQVDEQINAALRTHLGLLTPREIQTSLEQLNMTQPELAERLGIDEETLASWIDAREIQSRAMDNLLRVFFAFPEVRTALTRGQDASMRTRTAV